MGLFLVVFLFEHLLTNSQSAILLGENGKDFVRMVNFFHSLPYLRVIELVLIGVPVSVHMFWGIVYARTGKINAMPGKGDKPALPFYCRNQGYSWMRITAWIMAVGLIGHLIHARLIDYPKMVPNGESAYYLASLKGDDGLYTLAKRLNVPLYTKSDIENARERIDSRSIQYLDLPNSVEESRLVESLERYRIGKDQVVAASPNFGSATLLLVRNWFKQPLLAILYTVFILVTCFHAGHGFWTFLITWGVLLRYAAQKRAYAVGMGIFFFLAFLGIISIWGTYFF